jgi:hypothetical protein
MNEKVGLDILDSLATGFNKDDPVLQAIFSDYEGNGAVAKETEKVIDFIDYYTKTDDVRKHKGYTLEMITKLFVKLRRRIQEPDYILLRRMLSLTERKGDTVWGNAQDIEHIFETYFDSIRAYVSESTDLIDNNILKNLEFEEEKDWNFEGAAQYTYDSRFCGLRGLYYDGTASAGCFQTMPGVKEGIYTLHFFLNGRCGVIITDENGKYWNADETLLWKAGENIPDWQDEEVINEFQTDDWSDVFCFVILKTTKSVTIKFVSLEGKEAMIDYSRFFLKPPNPSYTIVIQYEGYVLADKTLHMGIGHEDPHPEIEDYTKESFFDHAFIVGRQGAYRSEVFQSLLDAIRPRGIQAFVEFVEKIDKE